MNAAERILLSLDAHDCWAVGPRMPSVSRGAGPPGVYAPLEAIVVGADGPHADFGAFGDDVSDPAKIAAFKAAMNAYRAAWTPYMAKALQLINGIGDSLANQAAQPQYASIAANLKGQSDAYKTVGQAVLAKWNMATTLPDSELLGDSSVIVKNYQEATADVAKFIAKAASDPQAKGAAWPSPPSLDDQTRVLGGMQRAAITPGLFDFFKGGVLGTARGAGEILGGAAKAGVGGAADAALPGSVGWFEAHKTAVIVGAIIVAGSIVLIALAPTLNLAAKGVAVAAKGATAAIKGATAAMKGGVAAL